MTAAFTRIKLKLKNVFLPGIEPGTLRVWGARDNHYTTETLHLQGIYLNRVNHIFKKIILSIFTQLKIAQAF